MPRRPKYYPILEKSIQAAISAIEIYNKPDFKYREECFSILMVNSWELLLKARILQENSNDLRSIYVEDKQARRKNGQPYKYPRYKKNRSDNFLTIDINSAIRKAGLEQIVAANIELLVEIRDNAIHFMNESLILHKKVLEIGTASLRSYVILVKEWFNYDLSKYNFYLMPLTFYHPYEMESYSINDEDEQHRNLLNIITIQENRHPSNAANTHNISLVLETKFVRSKSVEGLKLKYDDNSPHSVNVNISAEEKFRNKYPWNWTDNLYPKLKEVIPNFKLNKKFWKIKRELEEDESLCGKRFYDPNKPSSGHKKFYNPNMVQRIKEKLDNIEG